MIVEVEKDIRLFKERFALDLSMYDHIFLDRTIRSRMLFSSSETLDDYLNLLENQLEELIELRSQLMNSHSEFFRNSLTFAFLEQAILPRIYTEEKKNHSGEIRIWSAGCAAGQESYSLAMICDDFRANHQLNSGCRIFATDHSEKELELARLGIFDFKSVKNTRLDYVKKYFHQKGEFYTLNQKIKQQVDFSYYDLLDTDSSSPPSGIYGDFDLIMCCNVLFYYRPEYQNVMLNKFSRSLKPGGFLITGEAETNIVNSFGGFRPYAIPSAIFVKK